MAVRSGFFMSINGDRRYDAAFFAEYFASFIGNGIFPNPSTNLQVVEGSNMQTVVKPGKGWINGYYVHNDSDFILQHDVADGVLKRIDRVVMRLNYLTRQIEVAIKKGTFASSPVAPTLQRDGDYYELALADVLINNGATQIIQANIADTRLNKALCGIVHGTVDQIDTTNLFAQYEGAFHEWFESLQDILNGDVAANLADRIAQTNNNLATLDDNFNIHLAEEATELQKGHVQLASGLEVTAGTNTLKAVTPANLKTELDKKINISEKGQANGLATLDVDGRILASQSIPPTISGNYVGDGTTKRNVNIGITPKLVYIASLGTSQKLAGLIGANSTSGRNLNASSSSASAVDSSNTASFIRITTNGFILPDSTMTGYNNAGVTYYWVAIY